MVAVAVVQTEPVIGDLAGNLGRIADVVTAAAADGARLVVLPELCITGYMFEDRSEALALAEPIPDGPSARVLVDLAQDLGIYLVAGFAERDGDALFNSSILTGPRGYVGRYRKVHLWDNENTIFSPGDAGLPVFDTDLGRVGMLICYDAWFPEAFRALALQGADVVCLPTNWVPIPGQREGAPAMALSLCQAAAHVNSIHVLAADRVGVERGQSFIGQSALVGPTGWPLIEPASSHIPQTLVAEADLGSGPRLRHWNRFNDPLANRRPDVYSLVAEPAVDAALRHAD
jgi:predicted amidohydrolase